MVANVGKNALDPAQQGSISKRTQDYLKAEAAIKELKLNSLSSISIERMEAELAHGSIMLARREILKLQAKIEKWESIVRASERKIRKYKLQQRAHTSNRPGKPIRAEANEKLAKELMMKWVASLMEELEVKGCGASHGLEKAIPATPERNWRRWLNGKTVPAYSTIESLLDTKVMHGKYAGQLVRKVPAIPAHDQILSLLRFI